MSALLIALVVLALLAVLASWEQLRQLRGAQRALGRARRAVERTEERLADTRRALTTVTVQRDGFESDRYAARGEAARARHQIAALSQEVNRLRLRLAERPARTVELWPEAVARREVADELLATGAVLAVFIPAGPPPTWRVRVAGKAFLVQWGAA
jgi:septal ring factor EnvC (AmiA/AmiB activator)